MRFRTAAVAEQNHAHAGDTSRVVPIVVGPDEVERLFGGGRLVADLRHLAR